MTIINGVDLTTLESEIELLERRAAAHPDALAFSYLKDGAVDTGAVTFGELLTRVKAVAGSLQAQGLSGQAALLLYPPGIEFIVGFYACLFAQIVAIPAVPPRINRNLGNLDAIMADAKTSLILTCDALLPKLQEIFCDSTLAPQYRIIDTEPLQGCDATAWHRPSVSRSDLAFLQYTSGSTGSPKGVMVGHGNLLHNHEAQRLFFGLDERSRHVSWLPHYHDMGLIGNIMQSVYLGTPCWLMSPSAFIKNPAYWLRAITKYRATASGAPNFAYQYCVDRINESQIQDLDLSSWEVAYNGAEPVRAATIQAFQQRFVKHGLRESAMYPCYGMAEATLVITGGGREAPPVINHFHKLELEQHRIVPVPADHLEAHALVGCGRAAAGSDQLIRIVDPATGLALGSNMCGEIWVSSGSVCQGYLHKPDLSEQVYRARLPGSDREFARSGDFGFFNDQGELFITGRLKELLIVRGRNHYPTDIEQVIQNAHPALAKDSGAAFAIEVGGQERVVVVQELTRDASSRFNLDAIVSAASAALSEAFELQLYSLVLIRPGRIPKTSSGKIQRNAAKRQFLSQELPVIATWTASIHELDGHSDSPEDSEAPVDIQDETQVQAWLSARIRRYLQSLTSEIDPDQPLSTYGLDSTISIQLIEEIAQLTKKQVEPTLLWEYPTLNALSARITQDA